MDPTLILNDKENEKLSGEFLRIVLGDGMAWKFVKLRRWTAHAR